MSFRKRISLDGPWKFQIDPSNSNSLDDIVQWREATVPMPWQAQFDDLRNYSGAAWYQREFEVDELPSGAAILHFGAVDYHAMVWFNDQLIGDHEGGYLPFEFDVTPQLKIGLNTITVKGIDADDSEQWPDFPFSEVPHGKQSWYGPIGGIWQSVWLEYRAEFHLQFLRITPDPQTGLLTCQTNLNTSSTMDQAAVEIQVFGPDGDMVVEGQLKTVTGGDLRLDPDTIAWWSPDTPHLYTVTATLVIAGEAVDQISETCGFRTIEARDGRLYLNGEPIYLRGALDQAYYPETIYTPPSMEFLEDQIHKAKSLGLNCLRCHIKIEDPRYYEAADRLGILIWTEIPNWVWLTPQASDRVKETFRQMVVRDWNHPSIIAWTLVNENWGTDLDHNPEHRRWLAEFFHEAKALDPTRLVIDNSACCSNMHVASDIEDFHMYRAIPDHARGWDEWVADFANRADWAWAQDYAHERRDDLPLLVSEFGNWGLPHPDNIQEQGQDPWWFETGFDRDGGIVYPHGFLQRFDYWQLEQVFGSFDRFIADHQRHMALSLAYEIASMRLLPRIGGYVITEFTDVHWECNGLLDMQRNIKQNLETLVRVNQDKVVIIRPQQWSGCPDDTLGVNIQAFGVDGLGSEGMLSWRAGSKTGTIPAPGGIAEIKLPSDRPAGKLPVQAQWLADGTVLAQNTVEVAWAAPETPLQKLRVVDDTELAQRLKQLGYSVVDEPTAEDVVLVSQHYTPELQTTVQKGASLLLLLGPKALDNSTAKLPGGWVVPREGTPWQGDWATSFSWLKRSGPFANLPGTPLLDMPYADIMPEAVIAGVPAWAMRHRSWAGLALGWLHKPVSLLVDVPYGRGRMVVTTFKLTAETLANNVIAQNLLAGMVNLATRQQ